MMQGAYSQTWMKHRACPTPRPYLPLGVKSVGCYLLNRKWVEYWPPRWFSQLFWIFEGEGYFQLGGQKVTARPGNLFVYHPGTEHRIKSTSQRWGYCWLALDHPECMHWLQGFGFGEGLYESGPCPLNRFQSIAEALSAGTLDREYDASNEAHALLLDASTHRKKPDNSRIAAVKQMMDAQYEDPNVTIQSLADNVGIHRATLFRLFRDHYGVTPKQYLKNLRLHQALQMVQQGDQPVQEIARLCGYSDPNYLTRLVKKSLGRSAREMRGDRSKM